MSIVSTNQMAVTGLEAVKTVTPANKAKGSEKGSAAQDSQADTVNLSKSAVECFRKAVAELDSEKCQIQTRDKSKSNHLKH